jgi:hypothetical protein
MGGHNNERTISWTSADSSEYLNKTKQTNVDVLRELKIRRAGA